MGGRWDGGGSSNLLEAVPVPMRRFGWEVGDDIAEAKASIRRRLGIQVHVSGCRTKKECERG